MYGIYAYIDPPNHPNVGIYGIHGGVPQIPKKRLVQCSLRATQKKAACRRVVDKLRVLQDVVDQELLRRNCTKHIKDPKFLVKENKPLVEAISTTHEISETVSRRKSFQRTQ